MCALFTKQHVFQIYLTFGHILDVADYLNDELQVRRLAHHLDIPSHKVDGFIHDKKTTAQAGFEVLKLFQREQTSQEEAFQKLCSALIKIGLKDVARKLLDNQ